MRRTNRYEAMQRAQRYDGIILRLQKGRARQGLLTVFTRQRGLMQVWAPKGKKAYNQGFGSLLAFSLLTFEAWQRDQAYSLGEYESTRLLPLDDMTWDSYVYTQLFAEMMMQLMPPGVADERAYELLRAYVTAAASRNVRIATLIAGWQLTACAGFMPDTVQAQVYQGYDDACNIRYYLDDGSLFDDDRQQAVSMQPVLIAAAVRKLWSRILHYDWQQAEPLKLPGRAVAFLENLLCCYVEQISGKALKSRKLLGSC